MAPAATLMTPPPAPVMAPEGGRAKRKAKIPERFQSPPPAKRARPNPSAVSAAARPPRAPKHGGNGKDTAKLSSRTAAGGSARNRAGAQRHRALPPPAADSGVSAIALAALSSPSAAAMLGQSPVPMAAVADAMRDARRLAAAGDDSVAGLAMLLEASQGSPFRADVAAVAGRNAGAKNRPRAPASAATQPPTVEPAERDPAEAEPAAATVTTTTSTADPLPVRVALSLDTSKGWGEGARRKRSGSNATETKSARGAKSEKRGRAAPAAPAGAPASTAVLAAKTVASDAAANVALGELVPAVRAVAASAPESVLKHALRWIDLIVADLKGRSAALRRSRRRLQRVRAETEDAAKSEGEEATLLRDLDIALAAEGRGVDALLRQTAEMRAVAAGKRAAGTRADENASGERRGRPRIPSGGALLGECYSVVTAMLGSVPGADDAKAEGFHRELGSAAAAAFLDQGLKAAAAEGEGDAAAAAAAACPSGLVPTPHIALA
jgi:hypothetical protein